MLEIYLIDGTEEASLGKFLKKITDMNLAYVIKKAPSKHEKHLSCYVEAAYKQAGIWFLPLPKAHLRMLVANELVGPLAGQSMGNLMFASHPDPDTLSTIALHELGHSLKAVRKRTHTCVMSIKAKRDMMSDTKATLIKQGALEKLAKLHPDGMVDLDGAHCLGLGCIMQVVPSNTLINVDHSFCDLCFDNVKDSIKKINEEFEETPSLCGDCEYLVRCMQTKEHVYEQSDICPEFSAKLVKDD